MVSNENEVEKKKKKKTYVLSLCLGLVHIGSASGDDCELVSLTVSPHQWVDVLA